MTAAAIRENAAADCAEGERKGLISYGVRPFFINGGYILSLCRFRAEIRESM